MAVTDLDIAAVAASDSMLDQLRADADHARMIERYRDAANRFGTPQQGFRMGLGGVAERYHTFTHTTGNQYARDAQAQRDARDAERERAYRDAMERQIQQAAPFYQTITGRRTAASPGMLDESEPYHIDPKVSSEEPMTSGEYEGDFELVRIVLKKLGTERLMRTLTAVYNTFGYSQGGPNGVQVERMVERMSSKPFPLPLTEAEVERLVRYLKP